MTAALQLELFVTVARSPLPFNVAPRLASGRRVYNGCGSPRTVLTLWDGPTALCGGKPLL